MDAQVAKDLFKNVQDREYTDFSNAVKQELANKMINHPVIATAKSEYEKIQDMEDIFKKISNS